MSDITLALILGLVEGLTEFLPVSSTGHLILFGHMLEFQGDLASTFEIFIQLGAILAVVALYWKTFWGLLDFKAGASGQSFCGFQGITKLFLACLPAFVFGFLLHKIIKEKLFAPFPVALALILGGIVLILVANRKKPAAVKNIADISYLQCLIIGFFQCFALWPGMSRSGSTIVGGLLLNLEQKVAAEFSFLVAVPVMFAATLYDLYKNFHLLTLDTLSLFAVGFVVSMVSALVAIKFFLALLSRFGLKPFGYYRIALGFVVLALL